MTPGFSCSCRPCLASGRPRPLLRTDEHEPFEAACHAMLAKHGQQIQGDNAEQVPEAQLGQLAEHILSNTKYTCSCMAT